MRGLFWSFSGQKKSFSELFQCCFGDVQKLFEHSFWPKKWQFCLYIRLERLIFDLQKLEILRKILFFLKGQFDHFQGQKRCFFDFLKVVLELFSSCLGIVFGFKRSPFGCIFGSKGWYMTSKITNFGQILVFFEGHFSQNLKKNINFWGRISSFRAENRRKSWPFKFKNNA